MKRKTIVLVMVLGLILVSFAGCLRQPPSEYEGNYSDIWNSSTDSTYLLLGQKYKAVIDVNNSKEIELWESGIERDVPISVGNVKFRYKNGSITNVNETDNRGGRKVVKVPQKNGTLAYTSPMSGGSFSQPSPITGSARIILPQGQDARNFALGEIKPGGYNVTSETPLELQWGKVEKGKLLKVDYYDKNFPYYLIYLLIGLLVAAIGVLLYYRSILQDLKEQREELGIENE